MTSKLALALVVLSGAAFSLAQTTPTPSTSSPALSTAPQADTTTAARPSSAPAIPVTLAKSLDSKKVKTGDPIEARTAVSLNGNGMQIPAGSKVLGHVTNAKAKSKGDPQSSLTFAFDKIELKGGKEVPFKAIAQAIGAPQTPAAAFPDSGPSGPQTPNSGIRSDGPPAAPGADTAHATGAGRLPASDTENQTSNAAGLPDNAIGVVGMKGVSLNSQADVSTVSADSKSLKLDEGTQMLLRYVGQ